MNYRGWAAAVNHPVVWRIDGYRIAGWNDRRDWKPDPCAVWLQEIGWVKGCQATEAKVGMVMIFNGGEVDEIVDIKPVGKKFRLFTLRHRDGRTWEQRRGGLIPCQEAIRYKVENGRKPAM